MFYFAKEIYTIPSKGASHTETKRATIYKDRMPFIDEFSGLEIVKMLDKRVQNMKMLKPKIVQNLATLDVTNSSLEIGIFDL